ncbi:TetR/AcrR family transcriptional regulator [Metapseudomonas resinovorans]|uniref:Putative TetR family transcriptional regulator n=1 Tax=Metapseudomonas resinovorans NBRC 106553 TaxID=1245471 RepID=S6AFM7_METRE|nr:TetR/AcrR family transcriptional regulator [Pseudomonas resinovorans]BAN48817.1 putative TetR family transcriptional regulator [Pseudomonas resinovorans NBRC 106553]
MTDAPTRPRRGRPPKVERSFEDTRAALLRCGMELLTEQGFTATGIDAVLKCVGVPKGSFYHYFESKEAFGQALLDAYAGYFARKLDRWLLEDDVAPLQRLANFVEDAKAGMLRHDYCRGCLVGNLGQEVGILPESFREQLEATLCDWQARLARCLETAKTAGELAANADCRWLAAFFWIGWEGAVLRSRLARDTAPLDIFFKGFMAGLPR